MGLKKTLTFIADHPLNKSQKFKAIMRFIIWQLYARLFNPSYIHQFTPKVKLIIKKGMTGATGNLYCGLHEFNDMGFLLHFLRKEDFFWDIGANVGSYTLLAAGHVEAKTLAFEPLPNTFTALMKNIKLNNLESKVNAYNCAIGKNVGKLKFTQGLDTMNHVAAENEQNVVEVDVKSLDGLATESNSPALIKIDVEGFETEVIKGGGRILKDKKLKAIIIELNGSGTRYGYDEKEIHDKLIEIGYKPYKYLPLKRELIEVGTFGDANTIYINDLEYVKERLKSAGNINIFDTLL
jgi:FkbM family methyltransferase